jgi:hypothetical protein
VIPDLMFEAVDLGREEIEFVSSWREAAYALKD